MPIKVFGHYISTIVLAAAVCGTAYGFLSAYAIKAWKQEQLAVHQSHLQMLRHHRQELVRKAAILKRASQFTARARALNLHPDAWTLYDVNLHSPMGYEAAQEIVYLCGDSSMAYFWPISLEINRREPEVQGPGPPAVQPAAPADVQLAVKGRFAARR